jgi:hypothetical protein
MDWTGLDWTGLDWTGLDWTLYQELLEGASQIMWSCEAVLLPAFEFPVPSENEEVLDQTRPNHTILYYTILYYAMLLQVKIHDSFLPGHQRDAFLTII